MAKLITLKMLLPAAKMRFWQNGGQTNNSQKGQKVDKLITLRHIYIYIFIYILFYRHIYLFSRKQGPRAGSTISAERVLGSDCLSSRLHHVMGFPFPFKLTLSQRACTYLWTLTSLPELRLLKMRWRPGVGATAPGLLHTCAPFLHCSPPATPDIRDRC